MSQDNKANPNAYLQPDGSVAPEDRVKFLLAVEEKSKETLVNISTADILREKVRQCYRKEGVNHYENCKEYTEAYLKFLDTHGYGIKH